MKPVVLSVVILVSGIVAASLLLAVRAGYAEYHNDFSPKRATANPILLSTLQPISKVDLQETTARLRAYWHPSGNGSAIVMLHGTSADHSQLLPEAGVFVGAGYGVLLLDWPGHGESDGKITWCKREPTALKLAVDYAKAQGVRHVGVYAFSAGAMIALHYAAQDSRIEALVLAGAIESLDWSVKNDFSAHGWLTQLPALVATRLAGYDPRLLGSFSSLETPVLLIAGTRDTSVPPDLSRLLFAHLPGSKKQLWIVDGADHGGYLKTAPQQFSQKTLDFFAQQLGRS